MKFLIVTADHSEFLRRLNAQRRGLERRPYEEQRRVRNEVLWGPDCYSSNLSRLGYEAVEIHANAESIQKRWAREQGLKISRD